MTMTSHDIDDVIDFVCTSSCKQIILIVGKLDELKTKHARTENRITELEGLLAYTLHLFCHCLSYNYIFTPFLVAIHIIRILIMKNNCISISKQYTHIGLRIQLYMQNTGIISIADAAPLRCTIVRPMQK